MPSTRDRDEWRSYELPEARREKTVHERAHSEAAETRQIRGRHEKRVEVPIEEELLPCPDERGHRIEPDPNVIVGRNHGRRVHNRSQEEERLQEDAYESFEVAEEDIDRGHQEGDSVHSEELREGQKGYARHPPP